MQDISNPSFLLCSYHREKRIIWTKFKKQYIHFRNKFKKDGIKMGVLHLAFFLFTILWLQTSQLICYWCEIRIRHIKYTLMEWFYLGAISDPCCKRLPQLCQRQFTMLRVVSNSSDSSEHGWGLSHSYGVSLQNDNCYSVHLKITATKSDWKCWCWLLVIRMLP